MRYKLYLDNCCFNRPYDNQTHPLVKLETEAKLIIQQEVLDGKLGLIWSFILHYENNDNPYIDRKEHIALWEAKATDIITYEKNILARANTIMALGVREKDALHLSCAIQANADFFITTDKKLLNKSMEEILITNPIDFLRRYYDEN